MGAMTNMYLQIRKGIVSVDNFDAMINMHLQKLMGWVRNHHNSIRIRLRGCYRAFLFEENQFIIDLTRQ